MAPHDPFAPETVSTGAMLSANARDSLLRAAGLPSGILEAADSGWLTPDLPVLVRGAAKIMPLAWRGDPESGGRDAGRRVGLRRGGCRRRARLGG